LEKLNLHYEPAFPRAEEDILEMFKNNSDKLPIKKGFLQAILDNLPFNILVLDDNSNLTYVNSHFCNLTGYEKDELIGLSLDEFAKLLVVNGPYDFSRYPRILSGETISNYTYNFRNKKGQKFKVNYNSFPLRIDKQSKPIGCLCLIEHLTSF